MDSWAYLFRLEGGSGLAVLLGVGDAALGFDLGGLGDLDSEAVRDIVVTASAVCTVLTVL